MKKWFHSIKENRVVVDIAGIFFVAFLLSIPLFHKNIDLFFDDGSQHLMRAYGTYQAIAKNGNGNIIFDFANRFGYSWNLFYGPLSTYGIIVISLLVGTFNTGFKITLFAILFLAGSLMYKFVKEMTQQKNTACLASILYMTSPYFFTDIFVRHAVRRITCLCIYSDGIFRVVSFIQHRKKSLLFDFWSKWTYSFTQYFYSFNDFLGRHLLKI